MIVPNFSVDHTAMPGERAYATSALARDITFGTTQETLADEAAMLFC